jgi:hypothetical protein
VRPTPPGPRKAHLGIGSPGRYLALSTYLRRPAILAAQLNIMRLAKRTLAFARRPPQQTGRSLISPSRQSHRGQAADVRLVALSAQQSDSNRAERPFARDRLVYLFGRRRRPIGPLPSSGAHEMHRNYRRLRHRRHTDTSQSPHAGVMQRRGHSRVPFCLSDHHLIKMNEPGDDYCLAVERVDSNKKGPTGCSVDGARWLSDAAAGPSLAVQSFDERLDTNSNVCRHFVLTHTQLRIGWPLFSPVRRPECANKTDSSPPPHSLRTSRAIICYRAGPVWLMSSCAGRRDSPSEIVITCLWRANFT